MDTIVLKCGTDTTVHNCDAAWTQDGASAVATEGTIKKEGTNSAKITCSGAALQAHATLSSADLTEKLALQFWIRANGNVAAGVLQILLDDTAACTSPIETLNVPALVADTWKLCVVALATPASCGAIVSVGLKTSSASTAIVYLDNIEAVDAYEYETYGVSGFDDVDKLRLWPGVQHECTDGEIRSRATAFGRVIDFKIAPVSGLTKAKRVWLVVNFCLSSTRAMIFDDEEVSVALSDAESPLASEWEGGFILARAYPMTLYEQSVRTTAPDAWT